MNEDPYIKSLIVESGNLMQRLINYDKTNKTYHFISTICFSIEEAAETTFNIRPQDLAACIYEIIRKTHSQEGGDNE